jgi:hypothetical protein
MPHDVNGRLLKVGDRVTVTCLITGISQSENYCNLSLETVQPMAPGTYKSQLSLNTKQVELIGVGEMAGTMEAHGSG